MEGPPLRGYAQWLRLPRNVQKKASFQNSIKYPPIIIKNVSKIILGQDLIIFCHVFFNSFERLYF